MDFRTLNLLFRRGKEFAHKRIRKRGLSDTECMLCSYVCSHPCCSQEDAAQALGLDKTTTAKALRTLEEKGFLQRKQDGKDRRKKVLSITPAGEERISAILHLHDLWLNQILSILTEEEQTQFESYCIRLLRAAENLPPEPGDE